MEHKMINGLLSFSMLLVLTLTNSGITALADFLQAQRPTPDGLDAQHDELVLYSFADPSSLDAWYSRTDTVMGGISDSAMQTTETSSALFSGVVRFDNNGGFATVQTDLPSARNLDGYDGLTLRVRGDGKTYGISVRNTNRAIGYEATFATQPNTWQEVRLPWRIFVPKRSGDILSGYVLDPSNIRSMRLIISGQAGPYALEVAKIGAYEN
jgi:ribosomal protein L19